MFNGFSPETFDFLWGIRMNNNRDWFLANKPLYVERLYEPMKALGKELFEPFLQKPGNLLKVSRTYRDYGFFIWKPRTATLEAFRQDITVRSEEFLKLIADTEASTGVPITADCYKRPKPTDQPDLERFFAWRGAIGCTIDEEPGENLFTPELAQRVRSFFEKLIPLYDYFNQFKV